MNITIEPGASALLDALHRQVLRPTPWAAVSGTVCWVLRPTTGTSAPPPARSR